MTIFGLYRKSSYFAVMIKRIFETKLLEYFDDKKAIVILGARQIGKTTLLNELLGAKKDVKWLNGDDLGTRTLFEGITATRLRNIIGDAQFLVIDEAQRISDIGIKLKLITDQIKSVKLIVTGSSSLELSNKIIEPLTGRKWEFQMFPISFLEMVNHHGFLKEYQLLEQRMVYGYYPEVVTSTKHTEFIIRGLANDYLYKDILIWGGVKKSEKILVLLRALAYQLGNEVSYSELSRSVGLDKETVERYIDLLEKAFIIFRLGSYKRNLRSELKKSKKFFFYDNGIRNALISNFDSLAVRNDVGALWENFMISERIKHTAYQQIFSNKYFWRTKYQQEIDYVEERAGKLFAYEFKWNKKAKLKIPKTFISAYPESEVQLIHPGNFESFLGVTDRQ